MADKNIQMTQRNAENTGWDNLNPKTIASNVKTAGGSDVETQLAEIPKLEVATGVANALILESKALDHRRMTTFISNVNNNGTATTINGKPLYKMGTSTPPTLYAWKIYKVWYDAGTNGGTFFLIASAEGNAVASHVLAGDTFSTDSDIGIPGTMVNQSGSGSGWSSSVIAPAWDGTLNINIPAGAYLGAYRNLQVDNLNASNIVAGVKIGNASVAGAYITGTATVVSLGGKRYAAGGGTTDGLAYANITGLPFKPSIVIVDVAGGTWTLRGADTIAKKMQSIATASGSEITPTGAKVGVQAYNYPYTYEAWE